MDKGRRTVVVHNVIIISSAIATTGNKNSKKKWKEIRNHDPFLGAELAEWSLVPGINSNNLTGAGGESESEIRDV
jgi:hypothetical protein